MFIHKGGFGSHENLLISKFSWELKILGRQKGLYLSCCAEWRQSLRDFLWQGVAGIFVYSKLKKEFSGKAILNVNIFT